MIGRMEMIKVTPLSSPAFIWPHYGAVSTDGMHGDLSLHGGGGFFLACEDLGRMFDDPFPACAFLIYIFFIGN